MTLTRPTRMEMPLSATSSCLREVRKIVKDSCGQSGMSPDEAGDAATVAHELVINALSARVSDDPLLIVTPRQSGVLIKVIDDSPGIPVQRTDDDGENGRGLRIVEELATAWGFDLRSPSRKEVWALVRTAAATGDRESVAGAAQFGEDRFGDFA